MKKLIILIAILAVLLSAYNMFLFTVDETKTAVVKQFGDIVKVAREPGLYVRLPFIQNVI